jgi:glycerophosphoryl diester phosphodiesterase
MFPKFIRALLGLFLIFFIIYGILYALARPIPNHPYFKADEFLVIAHRGGRSLGPENTVYTFKRALELGTDVLEMDLQTTGDGALVVLHDREVDRTTNGKGAVDSFTLSELKKLDAGYRHQTIPALFRCVTRGLPSPPWQKFLKLSPTRG